MLNNLLAELRWFANQEKAQILQRFFKTWVWQYWEGDIFHWIVVPIQRTLVKKYYDQINLDDIKILLKSKYHEERLIWVLILVAKFDKAKDENIRRNIYNFYINNLSWINNWDLVDLSTLNIVWKYLIDKNKNILYDLAISDNLWYRRISILATFPFIRVWEFDNAIKIIKILLNDKEDLIHKACWWMLREIWKRNDKILINFLDNNINKLPRTTLRYAIEKFDNDKRSYYLKHKI